MNRVDALVIGAGPGGSAAALGLTRAGLKVAIVEKAAFPRLKVCGEFISATTWPILHALGAGETAALAGPPVRRVGLMAGARNLSAAMPHPLEGEAWGRALRREVLDPWLLARCAAEGSEVLQPARVQSFERTAKGFRVRVEPDAGDARELEARFVVAAHGSWERAPAPMPPPPDALDSDLIGFKARFEGSRLPADLMPLLLFPGGYGGMVHVDGGQVSFSCCIRRDALKSARAARPGLAAGEAVLAHARQSCGTLDDALAGASRTTPWLSAGPIRPGVRARFEDGVFRAGNAAGEAHPLIAEGISMAVQSASLLCGCVAEAGELTDAALRDAGERYARSWRHHFATRVRASQAFAALTVPKHACRVSVALLALVPAALTLGARFSGKARVPDPIGGNP
ncbi:MAG TPA: FAD-dependent monooxygenase [Usitatibacter sp.]|nr:FAD-dependent monooxygenase [Usitatibacter sp.]